MAKQIFYNAKKAKEEKDEQERLSAINEARESYFEALREDTLFHKYVISIIDEEIRSNENISGELETVIGVDAESLKSIIIAKSGGLASARNIKNSILNS